MFGQDATGLNKVFGFYEKLPDATGNTWSFEYTDNEGVVKDLLEQYKKVLPSFSETFLNFDAGADKLIFINGKDKNGFFKIDNDQYPLSGTLGYGPPLNPPIIKPLRHEGNNRGEYSVNNFTDIDTISSVGKPGYIQIVYTYITGDGYESNPSPCSKVEDYFFNYRDDDNLNSL